MEDYGIGNAFQCMCRTYSSVSRGSGRTSNLIKGLKPGDVVIVKDLNDANCMRATMMELGQKELSDSVRFIADTKGLRGPLVEKLVGMRIPNEALKFDHRWVEKHYCLAIESATEDLEMLEQIMTRPHKEYEVKMMEPMQEKKSMTELGFVEGATVRHYIAGCGGRYDDAVIKYAHPNGGLDVEIDGVAYGWSTSMCEVVG